MKSGVAAQIELERFRFQVRLSFGLAVFAGIMIAFHPGQKKPNETVWITILSNIVTLWMTPPGTKKESPVSIDSQVTNVSTDDVQERK